MSLILLLWFGWLSNCPVLSCSYLIGGSVLYYPQLSSISSYQLYVEVSMYGYYDLINMFRGSVMEYNTFAFHR